MARDRFVAGPADAPTGPAWVSAALNLARCRIRGATMAILVPRMSRAVSWAGTGSSWSAPSAFDQFMLKRECQHQPAYEIWIRISIFG
ncbi:hypothetical protein GQ55_2G427500 [Panicum hallii var. hallii]|uniref:Uncharacterized protein n=1 Tax=Panicum hallii var. hallii TaxID=1504633 RepID=A0A2T7EYE0_9POAL|nr:hypothetical protein GQ55_2G427500 [Panicum hallii var. hallii]